ncbi:multidrug resistance-associated protein, putative [Medicago truncatula]|uniref:Multidrug resistance-associated protein, putative n=2 Tax=Medicago truncatula TaxID=3880 RepID=A0A072UI24_MEDTR|nr:multidrug resistance-associated protein, putative [Medicago truncatula]
MKIIKLQSWEEKFKNLVELLRDKEFVWLSKAQILKAANSFLYWMSPMVIPAFVFVGCVVTKNAPLNAETIFTVLATLRNMGEPVRMIPEALSILKIHGRLGGTLTSFPATTMVVCGGAVVVKVCENMKERVNNNVKNKLVLRE